MHRSNEDSPADAKTAPVDPPANARGRSHAKSWKKRLVRILLAALVLPLLLLFLLYSGLFTAHILPLASQQLLGVRITAELDGLYPLLQLSALEVRQPDAAPILKIDQVLLYYAAPWRRPRDLRLSGVHLLLDQRVANNPNYGFLFPWLNAERPAPETENTPAKIPFWLPELLNATQVHLEFRAPEAEISVAGLNLVASLLEYPQIDAQLAGDAIKMQGSNPALGLNIAPVEGHLNVTLHRTSASMTATVAANVPEVFSCQGRIEYAEGTPGTFSVHFHEVDVSETILQPLFALSTTVPLSLARLLAAPIALSGTLAAAMPVVTQVDMAARLEDLRLGPPDRPWFAGSTDCSVAQAEGDDAGFRWSLAFDAGALLQGTIVQDASGLAVTADLQQWSREQVVALWPPAFQHALEWLPSFESLAGHWEGRYEKGAMALEGRASLSQTGKTAPELHVSGAWHPDTRQIAAKIVLGVGAGTCTIETSAGPESPVEAAVDLRQISMEELLAALWPDAPPPLRAVLDGKAQVSRDAEGYRITFDAAADQPGFGSFQLPVSEDSFVFSGQVRAASDLNEVRVDALQASHGEALKAGLTSLRYDLGKQQLKTTLSGSIELPWLGAMMGMPDLWGEAAWEAALLAEGASAIHLTPLRISFDPLGYDAWSIPYGEALVLEAPMQFDIANKSLIADALTISLGEATRLLLNGISITSAPTAHVTSATLETDMKPLVAKRWLDAAEGALKIDFQELRYDNAGFQGQAQYLCTASHLALPNQLAALSGVEVRGMLTHASELGGEGAVHIDNIRTAGIDINAVDGVIRARDNQLHLEDINLELFGGGVTANAAISPMGPQVEAALSGTVNNVDLSLFTQEYEPPSLILTGRVNGAFSLAATPVQLTALDIDLNAADGFSMNRDMVEQLLLRQYMNDVAGSKQIAQVVQSVLGEAPQRSFDSAKVKLGLEDGRITGIIKLESKALNLTVDVKADPLALLEALQARQQQSQ